MSRLRTLVGTAVATLITVELAARLLLGSPDAVRQIGNDTPTGRRLIAQLQTVKFGDDLQDAMGGRLAYDARLGWTNRPGVHVRTGVTSTVDDARHRVTRPPGQRGAGTIVLLGDSFTYGDEVADEETWAWKLAERSGREVINLGVLGYGLDQMLLRGQEEVPALHPDLIVVSVNALEVLRTGMAWDAWRKPTFSLVDGALVPSGPVPSPALAAAERSPLRTRDVLAIWRERATGPIQHPEALAPLTSALLDGLAALGPTLFAWQTLPEEIPKEGLRPRSGVWPHFVAWDRAHPGQSIDSTATMVELKRQDIPITRGAHWTPEVHDAWAAALLQRIAAP